MKNFYILENEKEMFSFSKDLFKKIYKREIKKKKFFFIALSGGKTPIKFFKNLTLLKDINWNKVFFFFVDERMVPFNDKKNNGKLAKKYLFDPLKIKKSNIFYIPTNKNAFLCAEEYENIIRKKVKNSIFDLIVLGIGEDGHTASLFPRSKALKENKRLIINTQKKEEPFSRISFSFPLINKAKNILILAYGMKKAYAIKKVFKEKKLPASKIGSKKSNLHIVLDKKAAFYI